MFPRSLILACVLAVDLVSADVSLSVQHDTINLVPGPLEVSSTRSLRYMIEETAKSDSTLTAQAGKPKDILASGLACSRIGNEGGLKVQGNVRLPDTYIITIVDAGSIEACCQRCLDTDQCGAFSFMTNACVLGRSGSGDKVENALVPIKPTVAPATTTKAIPVVPPPHKLNTDMVSLFPGAVLGPDEVIKRSKEAAVVLRRQDLLLDGTGLLW